MAPEDEPEEDETRMRGITVGGSPWCSLAGLTEMSALEEVPPQARRSSNTIFYSKFRQKSGRVKRTAPSVRTLRLTLQSPPYMYCMQVILHILI